MHMLSLSRSSSLELPLQISTLQPSAASTKTIVPFLVNSMELRPPFPLPLVISFFFVLILAVKRSLRSKAMDTGFPPGPSKLPFVGSIHHLVGRHPHRALRDLARLHGPVMLLRLGEIDLAVFSSREAAQEVLKTQDASFSDRAEIIAAKVMAYGCTDIAFSSGSHWRKLRKICVLELLGAKRVKNFASMRSEEVYRLIDGIGKTPAGEAVDLKEKVMALTNAIVTRASFGERCSRQEQFLVAMKEVLRLSSGFCIGDFFPSLQILDSFVGLGSKLQKIQKIVDEILEATIKEHRECRKEGEEEDLIDVLLRLKDQESFETLITYNDLKAVIVDMFFAGTDTTAGMTEWAMAELMRSPSAMAKVRREVREAAKGRGAVDESDVSELIFLRAVVKETLRLHPPAPLLLPRYCRQSCKVFGHTVPAGARVLVNVWALGRDPRYWVDAESFRPERFADGDASASDFRGRSFEYLPFGGGRRICPGMQFGLAVLELTLARLLFHFDWEMPKGMRPQDLDMAEAFGATASKKEALRLLAIPRYPVAGASMNS